jgi:hypothetical protein
MAKTPIAKPAITFVAPLTQEEVASLGSDDITKKTFDAILEKIDLRFSYVFEKSMELMGRHFDWYDFENVGESEDDRGVFDPDDYAEEIAFTGKFATPKDTLYPDYFPTRWLWENFEDALVAEIATHAQKVANAKEKKAQADKAAKEKRDAMVKQIKGNLTKEELTYVTFK